MKMKKQMKYIVIVMAVLLAAFSLPAKAADTELKLKLDNLNAADITSVKLGLKISNVSDAADVTVAFDGQLPEKMIKKATYKDGILNLYLAGTQKLFGEGRELVIGAIEVKNDAEGVKNYKAELIAESVEIINGSGGEVDYVPGEFVVSAGFGGMTEPSEPENPGSSEPENPEPSEPENPENPGPSEPSEPVDPEKPEFPTLEAAREGLESLLTELDKLLSSEYTAESWKNLNDAMNRARSLLENGASKEELEAMYAELIELRNNLVKKEAEENAGNSPNNVGIQNGAQSGSALKTGDTANVMLWVGVTAAAVGAVIVAVVYKKKKK